MDIDAIVDAFVEAVNATEQEPLPPDEVPKSLRIGEADKYGQFRWKICRADHKSWVETPERNLPIQFPPSYLSFISRYTFPAFKFGPIFFFGNTGQDINWELSKRIFIDEIMSPFLLQNGYLQIGNPYQYNYDPICFDTKKGGEYPIVQLDHEEIICNSKSKIVEEIAPSFLKFIQDTI